MKKRITLVTWLGGGNYGTSLQSFALHRKLQDLGYSVTFFTGCPKKFTVKNKIKYVLELFGINLSSIKKKIKRSKLTSKQRKLQDFIKHNYNLARPINSKKQLDKLVEKTDVFVTESDQIWNTVYSFNPFFFLDFAKNKKRIAYASSMGISAFLDEHKPEVKRLLSKFQHIGVRELTAVKAISSLLGRSDVQQVLDPTFLLDKNDWFNISKLASIEIEIPKRYIFCYLIGNNPWYKEQIADVMESTGIDKLIIVPAVENKDFSIEGATIYDAAGPLEFVKLIKEATLVCTDSFHATAISLNMEKPFVEFMRFSDESKGSQNSRIYDLLGRYNLGHRIYNKSEKRWAESIDYTSVTKQINEDRKKSLDFLVESIER